MRHLSPTQAPHKESQPIPETQLLSGRALSRLKSYKANQLGKSIFRDEASYNLYTRASGEAAKAHKMVRVLTGDATPKEITEFPDSVISGKLLEKMKLTRYYFFSAEERQAADKEMKGR